MPIAITRQVSPRFAECELTNLDRVPVDLDLARLQHRAYTQALESRGCRVLELPAEPDFPDSVFVEDAALVLPEVAVITRPGAASRRGEIDTIAEALHPYRDLLFVQEPATIDGGDVLVLKKNVYVGISTRSDRCAIEQIQSHLACFGYRVFGIVTHDCLHLKSAVTRIGPESLLINPQWVDLGHFAGYDLIEIDPSEPHAANILPIGDGAIYPAAFPKTAEKLMQRGIHLLTLDLSEISKAEGAVTCCSLIF